jgi:hypothetical protein
MCGLALASVDFFISPKPRMLVAKLCANHAECPGTGFDCVEPQRLDENECPNCLTHAICVNTSIPVGGIRFAAAWV